MNALIIYDNTGRIYSQMAGDYVVPNGLPYIEVEIPEGKIIVGVNPDTHEAIFEDLPKLATDVLQTQLEKHSRDINDINDLIVNLIEAMGRV